MLVMRNLNKRQYKRKPQHAFHSFSLLSVAPRQARIISVWLHTAVDLYNLLIVCSPLAVVVGVNWLNTVQQLHLNSAMQLLCQI